MPTVVATINFNLLPQPIDLCITRRDSFPFGFLLEQDGAPVDISGNTYQLVVDTAADGTGTELFAIAENNTPDAAGFVEFLPSVANLTQVPANYFFAVRETTPGSEIRTIVKGGFQIAADIPDS
jgi:hypothetical protein